MSVTAEFELSDALQQELARNAFNPCVGHILLSESERARVWFIRLAPGERIGFHRHVLDYFWTALTAGVAVSHINGGPPKRAEYFAGETRHMSFARGEYMLHDLHNVGSQDLLFITVEHLPSANDPLPLPADVVPQGLPAGVRLP
ncbi:hypothetical protein G3545_11625 [Starkeya sp. ORNL1]|uniref:hypothetical protein n=1 Tax=Starkeya sp. ORNL1 TaxID=2709380 RepID=UPI00146307CD|nr:hypothetical protein [Starkeya sp. ORNL1]QJP14241.1 hypothetical protein G3545_11625 [Starkeya sp. ORNL1]